MNLTHNPNLMPIYDSQTGNFPDPIGYLTEDLCDVDLVDYGSEKFYPVESNFSPQNIIADETEVGTFEFSDLGDLQEIQNVTELPIIGTGNHTSSLVSKLDDESQITFPENLATKSNFCDEIYYEDRGVQTDPINMPTCSDKNRRLNYVCDSLNLKNASLLREKSKSTDLVESVAEKSDKIFTPRCQKNDAEIQAKIESDISKSPGQCLKPVRISTCKIAKSASKLPDKKPEKPSRFKTFWNKLFVKNKVKKAKKECKMSKPVSNQTERCAQSSCINPHHQILSPRYFAESSTFVPICTKRTRSCHMASSKDSSIDLGWRGFFLFIRYLRKAKIYEVHKSFKKSSFSFIRELANIENWIKILSTALILRI